MICTALVRRLLSLCSQRLTRLLSNYLAFFDFRPEMVPPLDFLFILPVPSLSRRRPLKQKIKYYHSLKTFHNGARFWPKKYFGVIFVSGLHCKSRIIGQMSVCKCPLVTFSTPLVTWSKRLDSTGHRESSKNIDWVFAFAKKTKPKITNTWMLI